MGWLECGVVRSGGYHEVGFSEIRMVRRFCCLEVGWSEEAKVRK